MLGKKRTKTRNPKIIHKSTQEKLSTLKDTTNTQLNTSKKIKQKNKKIDEDEESISSNIESVEESSDNEKNNKNDIEKENKNEFSTNKLESYDEKKLRMAKLLIDKIDKDANKSENNSNDSENEENLINKAIIEKYNKEIQKQSIKFFEQKNFNPKEILFIKGHKSTITDLSISINGNYILTSSKDCRGILFDINSQKKILIPKFSNKSLNCCMFSPDEKSFYFGGKDHCIYQIDKNSLKIIQKIKAHNESVTGLLFDKTKEQFYSVGNDHLLKVWNTDTNPSILLETLYGHTNKINTIKNIPGELNKVITSSIDGYINLWKIDSLSFLQYNINDIYPVDCISALTNEIFFTGNFNGCIQLWNINKKKSLYKKEFAHGYKTNFNISHNFFSGNNKNIVGPILQVGNPILSLETPPYSDMVVSGSMGGEINFYEVEKMDGIYELEEKYKIVLKNKGCVNVIKYCQEKKFLSVGNGFDNKFGRWDREYDAKIGISIIKLLDE